MCDPDWFKQVNDQFGHEAGDKILAQFACTLRQPVPKTADTATGYTYSIRLAIPRAALRMAEPTS